MLVVCRSLNHCSNVELLSLLRLPLEFFLKVGSTRHWCSESRLISDPNAFSVHRSDIMLVNGYRDSRGPGPTPTKVVGA